MDSKVKNASQMPRRYFGLHMCSGTAEYKQENGSKPLRIFIGDKCLKDMNASFEGCPVVVNHLETDFTPEQIKETDGIVVKSFYNENDGFHWAEFLVTTDIAHEKIAAGWKLSNCYFQESHGPGGECHGVSYDKEVTRGRYEHLAIVNNPRYTESVIYTPAQFKEYNERKSAENKKLSNSREKTEAKTKEKLSMFNLFKREKIENSADLHNTMVELGKDKKQMSIESALGIAEKFINMSGYANDDHMVKDDDGEEMSVNEMKKKYNKFKKKNAEEEKAKKKNLADGEETEAERTRKKENESEDGENVENEADMDKRHAEEKANSKKKKNMSETDKAGKDDLEKEEKDEKAKNSKSGNGHYERLMNARDLSEAKPRTAEMLHNKLARGKENY